MIIIIKWKKIIVANLKRRLLFRKTKQPFKGESLCALNSTNIKCDTQISLLLEIIKATHTTHTHFLQFSVLLGLHGKLSK